jgi:hypothetical protein
MITMTPTKLAKQMLDYQKTTFDNAFNTVTLIQDQSKKMASSFLDQTPWSPGGRQKTVDQWEDAFNKGLDDFKKAIDESFEKMETLAPTKFAKQILDYQKTTLDKAFSAVTLIQDQGQKMASSFLVQTPWLTGSGQKSIDEWEKAFNKGRDDFKKAIDASFEKMETSFSDSGSLKETKSSQPPAKPAA